jgi:hypothetical protein
MDEVDDLTEPVAVAQENAIPWVLVTARDCWHDAP